MSPADQSIACILEFVGSKLHGLEKGFDRAAYAFTESTTELTFRKAFKEGAGSSLGKSVAWARAVGVVRGAAANLCNVM